MGRKKNHGDGWSFTPADMPAPAAPVESLSPERQRVRLALEKRGKGKTVTAVHGLVLSPEDMKNLARELKALCGSGGTAGPDHVEVQGDHRERVRGWLTTHGYRLN